MQSFTLDDKGIALVFCYLLSLLVIGFLARRASRESSLKDYYLAGSSLGVISLFFTLYATQYSGNSLFALPGKAYREGVMAGAFIFGVMGIVLVYQLYAKRLHKLAQQHQFISVGDFVFWRYQSKALLFVVNLVLIATLVTFILGNLKAVGLLIESASNGSISFAQGIIVLCVIMAVYEVLGGMRGVIWTDIIQGLMLMGGCLVIFFFLATTREQGVISDPSQLTSAAGDFFAQSLNTTRFISLVLLIAFGAAVYPQAIQRIYAARDISTLQRSYLAMFFMPLLTTLPIFLIGMSAAEWFPDLNRGESEQVVIYAINELVTTHQNLDWLLVLYIGAAIAAIMSTIDSALLSMGSIFSKDIIMQRHPELSQKQLHRISRQLSWILMAIMATLAIVLPQTIWSLLVLKLELVIQLVPLIVLGVRHYPIPGKALLAGLVAGCLSAVIIRSIAGWEAPLGIHGGLWSLMFNLLMVVIMTTTFRGKELKSE